MRDGRGNAVADFGYADVAGMPSGGVGVFDGTGEGATCRAAVGSVYPGAA